MNYLKNSFNLDFLLAQLSLYTKLILNKKPEYITYKTLISTNYTRIIRRLASITRTTTSKTYSIITRNNIYISYKGNININ